MLRDGAVTPYLLKDLDAVDTAYRRLRPAMPDVRVHRTTRCNRDQRILRQLHAHAAGFAIHSARDLAAVQAIGVNAADLLYSNPVTAPTDIAVAATAGVWRFTVDSVSEPVTIIDVAPARCLRPGSAPPRPQPRP